MINWVLLAAAVVLLIGLLHGRWMDNRAQIIGFKTPLSTLFIIAALTQPHLNPVYSHFILAGLFFGFLGDVLLALPKRSAFKIGLVAFLMGHVAYIAAFAYLTEAKDWLNPILLVFFVSGALVFWWLRRPRQS